MIDEEADEVYEIIASLPVEYSRANVLKDITFEAQLLIKSRFVKKIEMRYEDFKKIHEIDKDKDILLITEIEGKRYLIYIEKGKIVSCAMSDPVKGERIVGLKPLALLIAISRQQPVSFKVFEVQERNEDRTLEASPIHRLLEPPNIEQAVVREKTVEKREEKPLIVEFTERLNEFRKKSINVIMDTAAHYGCRVIDVDFNVSKGYININLTVKKKGLFSKCNIDVLKNILERDLEIILLMHDINLPVRINIRVKD